MPNTQKDMFVEQLVKRGSREKDRNHRLMLIIIAALVIAIPFFISQALIVYVEPVLVVVVALAVWIIWRRMAVEYEYVYTDGNLDVDIIYSKSSRRHLLSFDMRKVRFTAPADNQRVRERVSAMKDAKKVMACKGEINRETYTTVGEYLGKWYVLYWEPEEEILNMVARYSPRNTVVRMKVTDKAKTSLDGLTKEASKASKASLACYANMASQTGEVKEPAEGEDPSQSGR